MRQVAGASLPDRGPLVVDDGCCAADELALEAVTDRRLENSCGHRVEFPADSRTASTPAPSPGAPTALERKEDHEGEHYRRHGVDHRDSVLALRGASENSEVPSWRWRRTRSLAVIAAVTATTRMIGASQVSTGHYFRRLHPVSTGIRAQERNGGDRPITSIHAVQGCPHWDSNPDCADFKSAASANWAMGALQIRARSSLPSLQNLALYTAVIPQHSRAHLYSSSGRCPPFRLNDRTPEGRSNHWAA